MIRGRAFVWGLLGVVLLWGPAAKAQEGGGFLHHEVSVVGNGFFTKDNTQNGINQHTTGTGGVLVSYRYHFNGWLAAEAAYGYDRNTQQNFTSSGNFGIQSNVHQATGALVVDVPVEFKRMRPYALAGGGALVFDPRGNSGGSVSGAEWQAKPAFLYGAGVDYRLARYLALRVEYRGFVYHRPDFGIAGLSSSVTTHTAQPAAGIVLHF